jgi:predicted ferric reductase
MENRLKIYNRITVIAVFVALPVLIYTTGSFPRRTLLKETISLLTILAFFVMLVQFYLSRANSKLLKAHKMGKVIKWHKVLGYVFVGILLVHPFLIVLPRYFEAGVGVNDAFFELLSNFNQQGLLLGLIAWIVMFILGLMAIFRSRLPFAYTIWRVIHGYLSIVFVLIATLHVIAMGRHMNQVMIGLISTLAFVGVFMLLKKYILKSTSNKTQNNG